MAVLICLHGAFVTRANSDLTAGRFALFMDERITFDGVQKILHPGGLTNLVQAVVDGGDHRYGRSLWNTIAALSFVPERLAGESAQIVAARMSQLAILVTAFVLLSTTFVRRWALRFLLVASLLAMPYTDYYMSMPKPEPLQMLALAGFLYLFRKHSLALGRSYWLLLGFAFGTKISVLPVLALCLLMATLRERPLARPDEYVAKLAAAVGYCLIGLAVAVPILIPNVAAAVTGFALAAKWWNQESSVRKWPSSIAIGGALLAATFAVEVLCVRSGIRTPIAAWAHSTFLNTAHGADSSAVGFTAWVGYFFVEWLDAPTVLIAALAAVVLVLAGCEFWGTVRARMNGVPVAAGSLFLLIGGLALNCSIFLNAHRLWGMYLFPGTTLLLVGVLSLFDEALPEGRSNWHGRTNGKIPFEGTLARVGLLVVTAVTFAWWLPHSLVRYESLAHRTASANYADEHSSFVKVLRFLDTHSKDRDRRLEVSIDPDLFLPQNTERYRITEFWGPFAQWDRTPDVIVFGPGHTERAKAPPSGSPNQGDYLLERDGYSRYVIGKNQKCLLASCYVREEMLPNGGEILVLVRPGRS